MHISTDDVPERLYRDGYYTAHVQVGGEDAAGFLLELARSLGKLYVPKDCDPRGPIIRTAPTRTRRAAPFDRPEAIGWHGDFATYEHRPELSLVYVIHSDPRGDHFGAWRLASVARVIATLRAADKGRAAFELLSREPLPFSYSDGEALRWFSVVQPDSEGTLGLRFYIPSIRRGCIAEYGEVPPRIAAALAALERAAEDVAEVVPTREGSLLIVSNWFALHDRTRQTISRTRPNREALLCFVARTSSRPFNRSISHEA